MLRPAVNSLFFAMEAWAPAVAQFASTIYNPKGQASEDPNTRALGPKYHLYHSIRALKAYHLGPWTLRAMLCLEADVRRSAAQLSGWRPRLGFRVSGLWRLVSLRGRSVWLPTMRTAVASSTVHVIISITNLDPCWSLL